MKKDDVPLLCFQPNVFLEVVKTGSAGHIRVSGVDLV